MDCEFTDNTNMYLVKTCNNLTNVKAIWTPLLLQQELVSTGINLMQFGSWSRIASRSGKKMSICTSLWLER